jgi:uncharacterized membrane protein (DUF4010 family)
MLDATTWPYLSSLERLALALALGLFVGLERQRRGKEAGVRTFAFAALLGGLGGLLGEPYALASIGLLGLLVALLNFGAVRVHEPPELTTSAALLVTGFTGILCGQGHTFTPAAVGVASAALLAWKEPLAGFSLGLSEVELRAGILLGILAVVIYPALPDQSVDPWNLVNPREAWGIVVLIAAVGFANYVLWKIYGSRGIAASGFLGGLVNSTVVATEIASRVRDANVTAIAAYPAILLTTAAMILRNTVLLGLLAPRALTVAAPSLLVMFVVCLALAWQAMRTPPPAAGGEPRTLELAAPFSLRAVLRFGLIFLALQIAGTLAQRALGQGGFFVVSAVGGLVSSAGAVASAGALATHGAITPELAAIGAVLATFASTLVTVPLVARVAAGTGLARQLSWSLGVVLLVGGVVAALVEMFAPSIRL